MLISNIQATFWHISFENRFNGDWGLLKIQIMISHKKIHKSSISTTLLFLGKFANSAITQPTTLLVYYLKREEGCFYLVLFLIRRRKRGHLVEKKNVNIQQKVMKFCRNWQIFPENSYTKIDQNYEISSGDNFPSCDIKNIEMCCNLCKDLGTEKALGVPFKVRQIDYNSTPIHFWFIWYGA